MIKTSELRSKNKIEKGEQNQLKIIRKKIIIKEKQKNPELSIKNSLNIPGNSSPKSSVLIQVIKI
jgi:hypothetical protein